MPARWEGNDGTRDQSPAWLGCLMILLLVFVFAVSAAVVVNLIVKNADRIDGIAPPEPELPAVQARPVCEWNGPYPYTHDSLDLWLVMCPSGTEPDHAK